MAVTAQKRRGGFFPGTSKKQSPGRVLTASAARIDMTNDTDAKRERALRQGWQSQAWEYRDSIGEIRYALQFLSNATGRMKFFPAVYPAVGETDNPVPLADAIESPDDFPGLPADIQEIADQGMAALGRGKMAVSQLFGGLSTNISVSGECWLLGQEDPDTGAPKWSIRSIDEIVVKDDSWQMREVPVASQGIIPWQVLEPATTVLSRVWVPHPRFHELADSSLRACMDACETLLILRRGIRAVGRSRLATNGIMAVPEEFSIKTPNEYEDTEADPFMEELTTAVTAPIVDEGVASSVVPVVIRGPGDQIDKIKFFTLDRQFDQFAAQAREESLGVIATTIDLPKEVIMGISDLNHWSAWQVDDNTFRHHIEPHVQTNCDAMTAAYWRPYLIAMGVPAEWAARMVIWYDPTELVTHPDRATDANTAHSAMVISDEALRRALGFSDTDAPTKEELEFRQFQHLRNLPLNLQMEFARRFDQTLVVPPITVAGTVPGIKPGGVDVGEIPVVPGAVPADASTPVDIPSSDSSDDDDDDDTTPGPPAVTAAGAQPDTRLSRQLLDIDRDVRARLHTAANAAMSRELERAGARLRTKVAKDETMRTRIAQRRNEHVAAILGQELVTAAGFTPRDLLGGDWAGFKAFFMDQVGSAQKQALKVVQRLNNIPANHPALVQAEMKQSGLRDTAWQKFETALNNLAEKRLYNPDPNTEKGDIGDLNQNTLVPAGLIRSAMAEAGGGTPKVSTDQGALSAPVGQIGTGGTISSLITDTGGRRAGYEWVHASTALDPFEPHVDLDGAEFENFDDEQLLNHGDWPPVMYYCPGDHDGCLCDAMPMWFGADND